MKAVKGLPADSSVGQPEWTPDGMPLAASLCWTICLHNAALPHTHDTYIQCICFPPHFFTSLHHDKHGEEHKVLALGYVWCICMSFAAGIDLQCHPAYPGTLAGLSTALVHSAKFHTSPGACHRLWPCAKHGFLGRACRQVTGVYSLVPSGTQPTHHGQALGHRVLPKQAMCLIHCQGSFHLQEQHSCRRKPPGQLPHRRPFECHEPQVQSQRGQIDLSVA